MVLKRQHLTDKEGQKIPSDQEKTVKTLPPVAELPDSQDLKKDEIPPNKSSTKPKPPETQACSKIILVESYANGKKKCLWITPKPASNFKEYFESIPKVLFF